MLYMNTVLQEMVQQLPLEEKLELLDNLHEQVDDALNLMLPVPEAVLAETEAVLKRMKSHPKLGIPWREVVPHQ
jgi:hypothetical protein